MEIITAAKSLISALGIKTDSPLFGRENWIAMVVSIIAAATGIFYANSVSPFDSIPFFIAILIFGLVGLSVMSAFVYPLRNNPNGETTPMLAGLWLSLEARSLRKSGIPMFEIMEQNNRVIYSVWSAPSLAAARSISLLSLFLFVFSSSSLIGLSSRDSLKSGVDNWLGLLESEDKRALIYKSPPFPADIVITRARLEETWNNFTVAQRSQIVQTDLHKAIHEVIESYRSQENFSLRKPLSLHWSEKSIAYFREVGENDLYGKSLLQNGAIYLDIAQDHHTDYEKFLEISKKGEVVITKATDFLEGITKAKGYRMLARIYYDRARPKSLSDDWDDAYLNISYHRMLEALSVNAPDPSNKNLLQLARTVQKASANTSNSNSEWQERGQEALNKLYENKQNSLDARSDTINKVAYLNILGVLGHDVILNKFIGRNNDNQLHEMSRDLETIAIAAQNEAFVLVSQTPRLYSHRFDISYDLARMHAVNCQILEKIDTVRSAGAFSKCKQALSRAIAYAKTQQVRDLKKDLNDHPSWISLTEVQKTELNAILP